MVTLLQTVLSGILVGGVYGIVSMGLSLLSGVMRLVNFAHADLVMLAMYGTYFLFARFKIEPAGSLFLVPPVLFIVGVLLYRLLFEHIITQTDELLPQLMLTVGLGFLLENVAQMFFKPIQRAITVGWTTTSYQVGPLFFSQAQLIAFVISLAVSAVMWFFLTRTDFGRAMRAMVDDRDVAQTMGISARQVYTVAMGAASALAGVGGVIMMSYYPVFPQIGLRFTPLAFVALVMGGMGNVFGAFVSGMIVGVVQQLTAVYVAYQLQNAGLLVVFIAILLFKPTGLFGREASL